MKTASVLLTICKLPVFSVGRENTRASTVGIGGTSPWRTLMVALAFVMCLGLGMPWAEGQTITSPVPGSALSGSSVIFVWSASGSTVVEWWLYVGSSVGASDFFDSGSLGARLSTTVSNLPTDDGLPIFVRLWYRSASAWLFTDFAYTIEARNLKVKVLKACPTCRLPAAPTCNSTKVHWDQAATWVPEKPIRIRAVNIPEQSEISIYADIEVSTAAQMYLTDGHIFRAKYAGPGILRNPACDRSFVGSNVTTTNMVFPNGYWIEVAAGRPVYVHLDVINWSPFDIEPMTQDVYIYYTEVAR